MANVLPRVPILTDFISPYLGFVPQQACNI
jgi:hypothetical protein